ncbi:MAG: SpoIIE family protein phosphatase [Flavonifractor sp.]|nr:SpoIIE family protein phosphatase [Flavonifractor sp.]MCI9424284.1 SpoIIE family protein phosphatase [Flavonifractor sp.]
MAAKEKLKVRSAKLQEEMRETGRVVLRSAALVRTAECVMRALLGALLAGAEIFGGYAPFALGLVAASGSGVDGFCALAGACFGYLSLRGLSVGLRYAAAAILVYAVAFAFFDIRLYRKSWFMPVVSALLDGLTGFVYLSERGWTTLNLIFFGTELLLCGASAYFYRVAFTPWTAKRENEELTLRQTVSLLLLAGSLLLTLSRLTIFGDISLGRIAAALGVMAAASQGGMGVGAAAGVAVGIGMDLAAEEIPFYAMAYSLAGVMTGIFYRQGRLACAVVYVLSNGLAVLWTWTGEPHISLLYEVFIASVIFLMIPAPLLRRVGALTVPQPRPETRDKARAYVKARLEGAARSFQSLSDHLKTAFAQTLRNDNDAASVFDRTAGRVCKSCALQSACWQRDYVSTFNALNDALPTMLERGRGEGTDFPAYFSNRCLKFKEFLTVANEELCGLLYRRQFQARLKENRAAVCGQYSQLAGVLGEAAAELGEELVPDPARERRLRQHLTAQGIECTCAVYYDQAGHLRLELEGQGLSPLRKEEGVQRLSKALGLPLRALDETRHDVLVLVEQEPHVAVAGVAARKKEGQTVSGDTGAWFKHDDGSLYVLLCDGMGSGPEAGRESSTAAELLERFLRAGLRPEPALRTLSAALALRGEETGGFTTIDLLRVDLFTGQAEVYKYGAAPTYVRKGKDGKVTRITGASLPAGLVGGEGAAPDMTRLELAAGDWVLLATDGVAGSSSDVWLRERFAAFEGGSPKDLAHALIEESSQHGGATDDRTALVLKLEKRSTK